MMTKILLRATIYVKCDNDSDFRELSTVTRTIGLPFIPPAGTRVRLEGLDLIGDIPDDYLTFGDITIVLNQDQSVYLEVDVAFPHEGEEYLGDHPEVLEKYGWAVEPSSSPRVWKDIVGGD